MLWPREMGFSDKPVSRRYVWYICQFNKYIRFQFPHIMHHSVFISYDLQHNTRGAKEIIEKWEGERNNTQAATQQPRSQWSLFDEVFNECSYRYSTDTWASGTWHWFTSTTSSLSLLLDPKYKKGKHHKFEKQLHKETKWQVVPFSDTISSQYPRSVN